jgi:hypothetical protein
LNGKPDGAQVIPNAAPAAVRRDISATIENETSSTYAKLKQ